MAPIWVRTGKIARAPRSSAAPIGCSTTADPSGGTAAAGQFGNLLDVRDRSARAGGLGEQIENRVVVIVDGRERLIGIGSRLGIARYGQARSEELTDRADQDRVLVKGFPGEAGPEAPRALARPAGPTLRGMFQAQDTALERVYVFEASRRRECDQHFHQASDRHPGGGRATQQGAHVLRRVIQQPSLAVEDRKSTRLNSSHGYISYAVFCLKKKKKKKNYVKQLNRKLVLISIIK